MTDDVRDVPCPDGCEFRGRDHVHLESASTGQGQAWGLDNGCPALLDPFDLQRACALVRSPLHGTHLRTVLPDACYDASFGRVHVKPGCRCERMTT